MLYWLRIGLILVLSLYIGNHARSKAWEDGYVCVIYKSNYSDPKAMGVSNDPLLQLYLFHPALLVDHQPQLLASLMEDTPAQHIRV